MKKYEKEVLKSRLDAEEAEMKHLKAIYDKAAEDIAKKIEISNGKIKVLLANWDDLSDEEKSIYQSQIYQKRFQESLKQQIDDLTKELNSKQYKSITDYMKSCYEQGFIGAMYSIQKQGIPLIMPIDQKKVIKAMFTDSKISKGLYTKLGEDVNLLKKRIANNISRGIATADSYANIARNIASGTNVGFNRAMRIARTEGSRISNESAFEASKVAQEAGADIAKMWSAALDGRTRPHHRMLDGQIRELEEPFEVDGMEVMYPSGFGRPAEDINCRCALLQRAKWALDDDELETLKKRAEFFGLDKSNDFADFEKKYLKATTSKPKTGISPLQEKLEHDALEWYVSGEGQWINQYLRGRADITISAIEKEMIDAIERATSRAIVEVKRLFRSVDAEAVFGKMSQLEWENLRNALLYGANDKYSIAALEKAMKTKGKTISEKGFMSTTKDREVAAEWGDFTGSENPIVLDLEVPKGIKGKDMKEFEVEGEEQFEVLLAKDQQYKINDIVVEEDEWGDKIIVVKAELIP